MASAGVPSAIEEPAARVIPADALVRPMPPKDQAEDAPYEPTYKGFDEEKTRKAQATAERSQEGASAAGEDANAAYVDDGPAEAAKRRGESIERVGEAVERAARRHLDD